MDAPTCIYEKKDDYEYYKGEEEEEEDDDDDHEEGKEASELLYMSLDQASPVP